MTKVMVTGGAGFIGSHVADALIARGYEVLLFDNLTPQVHGEARTAPSYLNRHAELIIGDITDAAALAGALDGASMVIHLAAAVGVGQSMYDIASYVETNELGTATLLQALVNRPVERLVVASSMSIYGEGEYRSAQGDEVSVAQRPLAQLRSAEWDVPDDTGCPLEPVPTRESKLPSLSSIYALNKYAQEQMCLIAGQAYAIPTVALRFFNVFGPRQALSNPYTGVLAIFAARLLNGRPPMVFEDGNQRRDFVHVRDVAEACCIALESSHARQAFNIGSGRSRTIASVARDLARVMGRSDLAPVITGKYRAGDIRHCFADISRSRNLLGFEPRISFEEGLAELATYLVGQIAEDKAEAATTELLRRGLVA